MFGYVRPYPGELKVKEYEQFKAVYCGLCSSMGKGYGLPSRFFLNYDFAFLSMLLYQGKDFPKICAKRCPGAFFRRRRMCCGTDAFDESAGYSVILTYWKLRDTVSDERLFKSFAARIASLFIRPAYKRAAARWTKFDESVKSLLSDLAILENANESSLDRVADKFANILASAAGEGTSSRTRVLRQLLYHLGRWVYIIDALDDLQEDADENRYNPLIYRFSSAGAGILSDEDKAAVLSTLYASQDMIAASFDLLDENCWYPILRNIIYAGMPDVCRRVVDGTWHVKTHSGYPKETGVFK